jgi:Protein of unknown function (DUF2782)
MTAMNTLSRVLLGGLLCCGGAAVQAEDSPARPAAASSAASATETVTIDKEAKEPVVQRTVIDDGRAIIEELRVRGQLVKMTVHPKDGSPSYEIIVGDSSRDLSTGQNTARGATGKRVWNVLTF